MKKIFGKFTFMMLAAIIAMVSMCVVSCSSDDDTSNYVMEVTNVTGGGYSNEDLAKLEKGWNEIFEENVAKNVTESAAVYAFENAANQLKNNAELKAGISETLHVTMVLKDMNQNNKVIKTLTFDITK